MKLQRTFFPSVNPFPFRTMSKDSVVCKPDEDIRSTSGRSPKSTPKSTTTYTRTISSTSDICKTLLKCLRFTQTLDGSTVRISVHDCLRICMIKNAFKSLHVTVESLYQLSLSVCPRPALLHSRCRVCYAKSSSMRGASHTVKCIVGQTRVRRYGEIMRCHFPSSPLY